jgi:hypothetical protein
VSPLTIEGVASSGGYTAGLGPKLEVQSCEQRDAELSEDTLRPPVDTCKACEALLSYHLFDTMAPSHAASRILLTNLPNYQGKGFIAVSRLVGDMKLSLDMKSVFELYG